MQCSRQVCRFVGSVGLLAVMVRHGVTRLQGHILDMHMMPQSIRDAWGTGNVQMQFCVPVTCIRFMLLVAEWMSC